MSEWITQRGKTMPALGQPTRKECWITSYQMILHANGLMWDLDTIENKLTAGGFKTAKECRAKGIGDPELKEAADALKMGYTSTSAIATLGGVKNMLMLGGPLWVAGVFPTKTEPNVVTNFHHVVAVIGVDEEREQVCWVDPWKQSIGDVPSKGWIPWSYLKKSIQKTQNVEASLQYMTPLQAAALALQP